MAKNDFVKPMRADAYPLGHAKENKDASAYTGFKYPPGGGNDIGVYKQPMPNPNGDQRASVVKEGNGVNEVNMSVGAFSKNGVLAGAVLFFGALAGDISVSVSQQNPLQIVGFVSQPISQHEFIFAAGSRPSRTRPARRGGERARRFHRRRHPCDSRR